MNDIVLYVFLVLLGLGLGSFAGATVWRIRARQLVQDHEAGEKIDTKEYNRLKKLTKTNLLQDRSQCLHCDYTLRWYDLIPVISWLSLRGKCRHCRKRIGYFEPIIEIAMAAFFILSYVLWPFNLVTPLEIIQFVSWLAAGVALAILFAYDAKWFLLPDKVSFVVIGLGVISAVVGLIASADIVETLGSIAGSVAILSGLYFVLYVVSKGRWIGFGDIKLGLGLALLLSNWQLAFVALFTANVIGCLIVLPLLFSSKLKRTSRVPFGPLLIIGTIIAQLWEVPLLDWYAGLLFI